MPRGSEAIRAPAPHRGASVSSANPLYPTISMTRILALCVVVAVCAVVSEAVTSHQPSGVTRRRPVGGAPPQAPLNRVARPAGPPQRMRNLAKRAHHGPPAKRGYYPHRVPYSKPFPTNRKVPKFPPYSKPQKPSYAKYGAPHKNYNRPKTSYDSYSKPSSFGSYAPNSYQPKPYQPSTYQYNPPQVSSYTPTTHTFANQPTGYGAPSFATSSQNSNSLSVQSTPTTQSQAHSIGGSSLHSLGTAVHSASPSSHSIAGTSLHSLGSSGSFGSSGSLGSSSVSIGTPVHSSMPSSHVVGSASYAAPTSLSLSSYAGSSSAGSSYTVGTGSHSQSASTTYGVPHPTHGAPQPPSYASFGSDLFSKDQSTDQATSYVHFYQGSEPPKDSLSPSSSANTYSYSSTHYVENKHKGSVFDSDLGRSDAKAWNHQESKDKRATKKPKDDSSFKAPKQTFGFLPYDSDTRQSDKESSYSVGQKYYSDSVLSPNYYEKQSSSS